MTDAPPPIPTGDSPPPVPVVHQPGYGGAPAEMPAYGEAPALQIAHPGRRALAFVVDGVGTFALTTVIVFAGLFTGGFVTFYAIPIIPLGSFLLATILTATIGVTPGKALLGIKVVHVVTGRAIGAWSIIRSLVIVSPFVVGYLALGVISVAYGDYYFSALGTWLPYLVPSVVWIALFIVVCVRPRHRGVEDILARSVVVRSR